MIILSSGLYHYGDRAKFGDVSFQMNIRLFAYMHRPSHEFVDVDENYPAEANLWCKNCCDCKTVMSFIQEQRCCGDYHKRWNCQMHPSIISSLEPGVHIMGNLASA